MAKNAITENSLTVLEFLQDHQEEDLTAADIAEALDLEVKKVNGIVTAGLQKRKYAVRVPGVINTEEGPKTVKYIKVTEEGAAYNHAEALQADIDAATKDAE